MVTTLPHAACRHSSRTLGLTASGWMSTPAKTTRRTRRTQVGLPAMLVLSAPPVFLRCTLGGRAAMQLATHDVLLLRHHWHHTSRQHLL